MYLRNQFGALSVPGLQRHAKWEKTGIQGIEAIDTSNQDVATHGEHWGSSSFRHGVGGE